MTLDEALQADDVYDAMLDVALLLAQAKAVRELTHEENTARLVLRIDTQVSNGGFLQWMYNTSAAEIDDSLAALSEVGSQKVLALVREAISLASLTPDRDSDKEKDGKVERLSEQDRKQLSDLDGQFYDLLGEYMALCKAFIVRHRAQFRD